MVIDYDVYDQLQQQTTKSDDEIRSIRNFISDGDHFFYCTVNDEILRAGKIMLKTL